MSGPRTGEVTPKRAAEMLGVHLRTLATWRERRVGPPWRQEETEYGENDRLAPVYYKIRDVYAYLRGDLYWDDPVNPEWARAPEFSPLYLEALPWSSAITADLGGTTVTLTKTGYPGLPWIHPETNERLTTYRAAQLGFAPRMEKAA